MQPWQQETCALSASSWHLGRLPSHSVSSLIPHRAPNWGSKPQGQKVDTPFEKTERPIRPATGQPRRPTPRPRHLHLPKWKNWPRTRFKEGRKWISEHLPDPEGPRVWKGWRWSAWKSTICTDFHLGRVCCLRSRFQVPLFSSLGLRQACVSMSQLQVWFLCPKMKQYLIW